MCGKRRKLNENLGIVSKRRNKENREERIQEWVEKEAGLGGGGKNIHKQ